MKGLFSRERQANGYSDSIQKGLSFVRYGFGRQELSEAAGNSLSECMRLKEALGTSERIVIGAGAGLSTAAGFTYSGERFLKYFKDFADKYGIADMYSGGFYPFRSMEIFWAWWSRHIYFNRYTAAAKPVYKELFELVRDKDYFVLTTNVDHQFQKAGFDKKRLFYTQGDYGLLQCVKPCKQVTYDNMDMVLSMMEAQGFVRGGEGAPLDDSGLPEFELPKNAEGMEDISLLKGEVPKDLVPICPEDGSYLVPNLRSDQSFVEDAGWHEASERYAAYLEDCEGKSVLFLELGVGGNTPVIIKYPFWQMTSENPKAIYACLNLNEAFCPKKIEDRSILIDAGIEETLALCK